MSFHFSFWNMAAAAHALCRPSPPRPMLHYTAALLPGSSMTQVAMQVGAQKSRLSDGSLATPTDALAAVRRPCAPAHHSHIAPSLFTERTAKHGGISMSRAKCKRSARL